MPDHYHFMQKVGEHYDREGIVIAETYMCAGCGATERRSA